MRFYCITYFFFMVGTDPKIFLVVEVGYYFKELIRLFCTFRSKELNFLVWDRAALTPTLRHWTFPLRKKDKNSPEKN